MIVLLVVVVLALLVAAMFIGTALLPMLLPLALIGATTGTSLPAPGLVPPAAALPPMGPSMIDGTELMGAVAPWMGVPYVFGGNTRGGVDCSGFTVAIFRQVRGVQLPRTAQLQFNVSEHPSQPDFGDLVFFAGTYDSRPDFISHVGIYIGDGWMISAIQPVLGRQNLNDAYWRAHLVGFGRIPNG